MSDSQEAYDAKCPALEAHEADRGPTVEERLEREIEHINHWLDGEGDSEPSYAMARRLHTDALAKLREQAARIEELERFAQGIVAESTGL